MKYAKIAFAAAALATTGCVFDSSGSSGSGAPSVSGENLFAMGTLYSTDGGTAALDRVGSDSAVASSLKTWPTSDVVLDADSTGLYAIERTNGVVTRYAGGDPSKVSFQVNVGGDADPYAVAAVGGKVWVACYGSGYLKAIDPASAKLVDSIDLSRYSDTADSQVVPCALSVHAFGAKLAVVLGRLNGWDPGDSSVVVVVDPSTRQVEKRIALPWKNAYSVAWSGSQVLVACTGKWNVEDGGVALVDLQAGTETPVVSEQALGGDADMVSFGPAGKIFVTVNYAGSAKIVDLSTGAVGASVSGTAKVGSLLWDGASLWIGDMTSASPTLLRVDATGKVLWAHATTLPPGSLAILPE